MPVFHLIYTSLIRNIFSFFSVLVNAFVDSLTNEDDFVVISDKFEAKIHEEAEKLGYTPIDHGEVKRFLIQADANHDNKLTYDGTWFHLQNFLVSIS